MNQASQALAPVRSPEGGDPARLATETTRAIAPKHTLQLSTPKLHWPGCPVLSQAQALLFWREPKQVGIWIAS